MSKKQAVVFGPALAVIRKGKGWNQSTLARRSGISEGLIANLEVGNRQPSRDTLVALAFALEVPVESIGLFLSGGDADALREQLPELVLFTRAELAAAA